MRIESFVETHAARLTRQSGADERELPCVWLQCEDVERARICGQLPLTGRCPTELDANSGVGLDQIDIRGNQHGLEAARRAGRQVAG
jgi:hypothetical protein